MKIIKLFLFILLSLFLLSCSKDNSNDMNQMIDDMPMNDMAESMMSNIKEFNVVIGHNGYSPNSFIVKKGDTIKFLAKVATGTSSHMHGISIDEFNVNQAVTDENNPMIIEFVADKVGTFSIYCKTCWDGPFGRNHPDIRANLVVEE